MLRNHAFDRLLQNPRRAAIVDHLRAHPGLSFADLRGRIASVFGGQPCGYGALSHHLYCLERAGVLTSRRSGRHRRYYEARSNLGDPSGLSVVQRPRTFQVARLITENGWLSWHQIAEGLSHLPPLSRQAVTYHLRLLMKAGLVVEARDGRTVRYASTPRLAPLVAVLTQARTEGSPMEGPTLERPAPMAAPCGAPSPLVGGRNALPGETLS